MKIYELYKNLLYTFVPNLVTNNVSIKIRVLRNKSKKWCCNLYEVWPWFVTKNTCTIKYRLSLTMSIIYRPKCLPVAKHQASANISMTRMTSEVFERHDFFVFLRLRHQSLCAANIQYMFWLFGCFTAHVVCLLRLWCVVCSECISYMLT